MLAAFPTGHGGAHLSPIRYTWGRPGLPHIPLRYLFPTTFDIPILEVNTEFKDWTSNDVPPATYGADILRRTVETVNVIEFVCDSLAFDELNAQNITQGDGSPENPWRNLHYAFHQIHCLNYRLLYNLCFSNYNIKLLLYIRGVVDYTYDQCLIYTDKLIDVNHVFDIICIQDTVSDTIDGRYIDEPYALIGGNVDYSSRGHVNIKYISYSNIHVKQLSSMSVFGGSIQVLSKSVYDTLEIDAMDSVSVSSKNSYGLGGYVTAKDCEFTNEGNTYCRGLFYGCTFYGPTNFSHARTYSCTVADVGVTSSDSPVCEFDVVVNSNIRTDTRGGILSMQYCNNTQMELHIWYLAIGAILNSTAKIRSHHDSGNIRCVEGVIYNSNIHISDDTHNTHLIGRADESLTISDSVIIGKTICLCPKDLESVIHIYNSTVPDKCKF